jgi:5-methylcytosine-specific restriction enzyme subunit McrC
MNKLFEEYVGRIAIRAFAEEGLTIRLQGPSRYLLRDAATGKGAFQAQPDIVALRHEQPLWIIDTKWKRLESGETYFGVAQADIYQMLGYARRFGVEDVVLLYPHTDALGCAGELAAYEILTALQPDSAERPCRIRIATLQMVDLDAIVSDLRSLLDFREPGARSRMASRAGLTEGAWPLRAPSAPAGTRGWP